MTRPIDGQGARRSTEACAVISRTKQGKDIACWVLKCNPAVYNVAEEVLEFGEVTAWSLADNYRKDLMEPGQPCLLWVTGAQGAPVEAGFYAAGTLVEGPDGGVLFLSTYSEDVAANDSQPEGAVRTFVRCRLRWLRKPVMKKDLLRDHPGFARSEVVAAAQGSNPRLLSPEEYEIVRSHDLSPGPVTDEQLQAFAEVHGDAEEFLLATLPDGQQLILVEEGAVVVAMTWFEDRQEAGDSLFRSDTWSSAVRDLASRIVPRQDQYPLADDEATAVIAYETEDHDVLLYREGANEWVQRSYGSDGAEVDNPELFDSLAEYLDCLAEEWDDEKSSSDGDQP